mmetsp:Transcript_15107/g.45281  ORF Transcript_15107/g.45281 Transcript_15107/m.45281 type:complete len:289 (+) Transcript_15107:461-1327(+)
MEICRCWSSTSMSRRSARSQGGRPTPASTGPMATTGTSGLLRATECRRRLLPLCPGVSSALEPPAPGAAPWALCPERALSPPALRALRSGPSRSGPSRSRPLRPWRHWAAAAAPAPPGTSKGTVPAGRPQLAIPLIGQFLQAVTRTLLGTWPVPSPQSGQAPPLRREAASSGTAAVPPRHGASPPLRCARQWSLRSTPREGRPRRPPRTPPSRPQAPTTTPRLTMGRTSSRDAGWGRRASRTTASTRLARGAPDAGGPPRRGGLADLRGPGALREAMVALLTHEVSIF